jgi:hypothetical protein
MFLAYVEKQLPSELIPGDIVIRDNLSLHKGAYVRKVLEQYGSQLRHQPPTALSSTPSNKPFPDSKTMCAPLAPANTLPYSTPPHPPF